MTESFSVTANARLGTVTGTVRFGGEPVNQIKAGHWDDTSKKLVFTQVIDAANSSKDQIFTGYWFARKHTSRTVRPTLQVHSWRSRARVALRHGTSSVGMQRMASSV